MDYVIGYLPPAMRAAREPATTLVRGAGRLATERLGPWVYKEGRRVTTEKLPLSRGVQGQGEVWGRWDDGDGLGRRSGDKEHGTRD